MTPPPDDPFLSLRLEDPDRASDSPLARIVESHLRSRDRLRPFAPADLDALWSAGFFGLDRVRIFRQATPDERCAVLAGCARSLLNEAYFIEKAGTAYCARMILLAEQTDVRQVYGLIAADEASHLQWVRPFVPEADRGAPGGPLLRFLSELIGECDLNTLAFLVQIILEGWGLHHYRSLSQSCRHPALRQIFHAIHKDEALHHHTGEVVFDPERLVTTAQKNLVRDSLHAYAEIVRAGPQEVVRVLDEVFGGLTRRDKETAFAELRSEAQSQEKLALLRGLMIGPGREQYVADLEDAGAFTPYAPAACAAILD